MNSIFLLIVLAIFLSLSLYLGSFSSGRVMLARKLVAGCGAISFAIYGIAVPDARSESLIMTAMAVVILYYLSKVRASEEYRE